MTPPINIGGDTVDAITIDGTSVSEVTVDGSTVFSAIPDGEHFYVTDRSSENRVNHDSLSTAFDLSSDTEEASLTGSSDRRGGDIRPNGVAVFVCAYGNSAVEQYNLSTDYDLSTASADGSLSVSQPHGIDISPDGKDAIITNDRNGEILHATFSTAWDISTGSTSVYSPRASTSTAAPLAILAISRSTLAVTVTSTN